MPHTIAVVEDDAGLRDSLALLITGAPGWKLTGSHPSAEAALPALTRQPPEVVLMVTGVHSARRSPRNWASALKR